MATGSPLPLALAFCAGSMMTVLVWSITMQPGSSASPVSTGEQSAVIAELRDLRASVDRLGRLPTAQGPAAGLATVHAANQVGMRSPDLSPVLESLGRTLERLDEKLAGNGQGTRGITQARALRHDIDWNALLPIAQAMTRDRMQAKKAVRFLTPAEVLERFGPPSEVYSPKGSAAISWNYQRTGIYEGEETVVSEVTFRIQDGYVIDAWGDDDETERMLEAQDSGN